MLVSCANNFISAYEKLVLRSGSAEPNIGHTGTDVQTYYLYILNERSSNKYIVRHMPCSVVSTKTTLYIYNVLYWYAELNVAKAIL